MTLATWQVGEVFLSMLWFTLFFLWIWLVITVFGDIFRSRDLGGWAKAIWSLFIIVLPYLGVLAYLIARGHKIGEHRVEDVRQTDAAMQSYIRSAAATPTSDLVQLTDLHDRGVIDDVEYESMKRRVVVP
ncbi:MAG TPA: PLDc N-terminal domain-containing protein [Acidimicrobiales bacterium]|nr:PLDc N-terminal domain-containing protein [Acidimicrobiales bacterium]